MSGFYNDLIFVLRVDCCLLYFMRSTFDIDESSGESSNNLLVTLTESHIKDRMVPEDIDD
jgi:hypothetical protein